MSSHHVTDCWVDGCKSHQTTPFHGYCPRKMPESSNCFENRHFCFFANFWHPLHVFKFHHKIFTAWRAVTMSLTAGLMNISPIRLLHFMVFVLQKCQKAQILSSLLFLPTLCFHDGSIKLLNGHLLFDHPLLYHWLLDCTGYSSYKRFFLELSPPKSADLTTSIFQNFWCFFNHCSCSWFNIWKSQFGGHEGLTLN